MGHFRFAGTRLPLDEERQLLALPTFRNVQGFPQRFQKEGCKSFFFHSKVRQKRKREANNQSIHQYYITAHPPPPPPLWFLLVARHLIQMFPFFFLFPLSLIAVPSVIALVLRFYFHNLFGGSIFVFIIFLSFFFQKLLERIPQKEGK